MKKFILSLVFSLLASNARGDFTLGTDAPPSSPLYMNAGTTSGPMMLNVTDTTQDLMLAWQVNLVILPINGASGSLVFQDPSLGYGSATNPNNYIFSNGLGIATDNLGTTLTANDFDLNGGTAAPNANLLQMDFLASADASGIFGVYALEGAANTLWTDQNGNTQYFSNAPDGTDLIQIGEIVINSAGGPPVTPSPEPTSWLQLCLGSSVLCLGLWKRNKRKVDAPCPA